MPFWLLKFVPRLVEDIPIGQHRLCKDLQTLRYHLLLHFHFMAYSHFSLTPGYDGMVWNNASATAAECISWQSQAKPSLAARLEGIIPLHQAGSFHPAWLQINLGSPWSLCNSLQFQVCRTQTTQNNSAFPFFWKRAGQSQQYLKEMGTEKHQQNKH